MTPTLEQRLEHGWALIDEASTPEEAHRLTDHWLNLLDQYQREQDVLHWEIAAQHEWRAHMNIQTFSPVPSLGGAFIHAQGVLQNI